MPSDVTLYLGDCLDVMRGMDAGSVDAVICDPPYGLSFMGKGWDHGVPGAPFWEAALRVAKPGAMLLAFGGTRTHHRLMCAIEDAGWEIRDCLMWLYGSGFPKSMDISKAIDKAAGAEREVVSESPFNSRRPNEGDTGNGTYGQGGYKSYITAPATDAAQEWQGWGTALKPAWEPIIMAMKSLDGTFANNALMHGVAGINVDGCRVGDTGARNNGRKRGTNGIYGEIGATVPVDYGKGRWPANLLLDEGAAAMLDEQVGTLKSGGASRFFYVAKASRADRNEGLDRMPEQTRNGKDYRRKINTSKKSDGGNRGDIPRANHHPTVKPTQLMRYLCKMVTRSNGVILDPFMGSGSTGKAAMLEGFCFAGIELDPGYFAIAQRRIEEAQMQLPLLEAI